MSLRVLMFGWEFPPHHCGGLGTACFGITRALAQDGADITLVLPHDAEVEGDFVHTRFAGLEKVKHVPSRLFAYANPTTFYATHGFALFDEVCAYGKAATRIAREETFDVIHAHDWLSALAGIEAKRVSGKPLVLQIHATEFDRCAGDNVNKEVYAIERAGMQAADSVVAVSELTKETIVERYAIPAKKVTVLHNGMDADYFATVSGEAKRRVAMRARAKDFTDRLHKSGGKLVLFAGRVTIQKGPDYFVQLARRVTALRRDVFFLIAGGGDMDGQVITSIAKHGLSDRCFFFGRYEPADIEELYRAADLYVFPSVSEPFGITVLEAASLGAPVLLSKQTGVAEVLKNVLTVDFWDIDEMVNKTLTLLDNPALGETLRTEAAKELPALTWQHASKKLMAHYKELTKKSFIAPRNTQYSILHTA